MKGNKKDNVVKRSNRGLIKRTVISLMKESKYPKMPTYQEIADASGLAYQTVYNHINDMKFDPIDDPRFKLLHQDVIMKLYQNALRSTQAQRLWLEFFGYLNKFKIESENKTEVTVNQYKPGTIPQTDKMKELSSEYAREIQKLNEKNNGKE